VPRAGYSLVEVLAATVIVGVLAAAATTGAMTIQEGLNESQATAVADDLARRVLDRLVPELRRARRDSVRVTDGTMISFESVDGWTDTEPRFSATQTISFNGGSVYMNGATIASGVAGLDFAFDGSTLALCIKVVRSLTIEGKQRTIARSASVRLRL
jgi:prepilin-type N-terminal cleavage/methylation domain-containing protein